MKEECILCFPAEKFDEYRTGGYHPIHLGDYMHDGRYEILHRLGAGASSTVWLAKDNSLQINVCMKVLTADRSQEQNK
ncbi:hypothetical protein BDN72DRAFT_890958 [Pluteus cervinus]|uniref:Uncharacterized protein n=1 Tax=Pluteus cervinus TaxID=181527 RepID=A0ACD3BHY0_9AGAR|nr:hypothetical protein BDN72DRAFT_890958 [Pluteus cervinus]